MDFRGFAENGIIPIMLSSTIIVFLGLGLGWWFYGRKPIKNPTALDALERLQPQIFNVLRGNMSLVGPRPHAVAHNEKYAALIDGYLGPLAPHSVLDETVRTYIELGQSAQATADRADWRLCPQT